MASRYSAARPKRAGEEYARSYRGRLSSPDSTSKAKKIKFDIRNPSTLAPDAPDENDVVLDADVIGKGRGATKRGAVNIEGYDSDSENENFDTMARHRKGGDVDLGKKMESYNAKEEGSRVADGSEDDEDDDMFAPARRADGRGKGEAQDDEGSKKKKSVSFLDPSKIQGAEEDSKSGGQVRTGSDNDGDTDEEKIDAAMEEQGLDLEVGRGGLKRHAPKVEAFNMKEEQEEGRFDQDGNYVRKAIDPDAQHDRWLDGLSRKDIRRAAEAHEKREAEQRKARLEDDRVLTSELLTNLILNLERGETPLEALARLGRDQRKTKPKQKKFPKWKLKKKQQQKAGSDVMDVDQVAAAGKEASEDQEKTRIKNVIDSITEAADRLMGRGRPDVYDKERELLIRDYRRETEEDWVEPERKETAEDQKEDTTTSSAFMWEFRWTDGRDGGQKQGPFDGLTMKAWKDAGYFTEDVEFRVLDNDGGWSRVADFV